MTRMRWSTTASTVPKASGAILVALLLLTGCASAVPGDETPATPTVEGGEPLAGTAWVMESMGGDVAAENSTMTVQFGEDGTISGSGGCNRYSGQYTVTGDALTIEPLAATMMACEQPVMDQEAAFLTALQEAKAFSVEGDMLALLDAEGGELLEFSAQSEEFSGSSWVVTGYNNGERAIVSPVADTAPEVFFDEDGSISGSGGCNRFMGTFTVEGSTITIEQLASSKMTCPEPAGVMEQESALIAALESATGFAREGDELSLTSADGATAVTLTRG